MTANHTGGGKSLADDFNDIDAMPRPIKEVYWRAPLNIGTFPAGHVRKVGVALARAEAIVSCASWALKNCLKTYGPEHTCAERLAKAMTIGRRMAS